VSRLSILDLVKEGSEHDLKLSKASFEDFKRAEASSENFMRQGLRLSWRANACALNKWATLP
jgi:hypothetical protein